MKRFTTKLLLLMLLLLLLLCLTAFPAVTASAADFDSYDYYIKDFKVDVVANSDRSYEVTEVITAVFNIESRGIFRDIDTVSDLESYSVENIHVHGEPFTVTNYSDYINVRIGDPDIYLTGEKTYTITYTRVHYADGEPDYDYFYMDLIGDRWDTPILNFTATVVLPDAAQVNKTTLTSGPLGSVDNDYAVLSKPEGNMIRVSMKRPLEPYMAVTLNVQMLPGAFADAVVYVPPLVIHSVEVTAELDAYGVMTLTEVYDATVQESARLPRATYGMTDYAWFGPDGAEYPFSVLSSEFFGKYSGERIRFYFTGKVKHPISQLQSSYYFEIDLPGSDDGIYVESYFVSVNSPFEISSVEFYDRFNRREPGGYVSSLSNDGKSLRVEAEADPSAYYASVGFRSSGFRRASHSADYIVPIAAAVVALAIFYFAFIKDPERKLAKVVLAYPPDNMNPAELGYVIDGSVSNRDVTSLIYYWASHGHLSIEIPDRNSDFILHKNNTLDDGHRPYEKGMFEALWVFGDGANVAGMQLEDRFYTILNRIPKEVVKFFSAERSLDRAKRAASFVAFLMILGVVALYYALSRIWHFDTDAIETGLFLSLFLCIGFFPAVLSCHKQRFKRTKFRSVILALSIVLYAIFAFLFFNAAAGRPLALVSTAITIVSLAVAFFSTPYLRRKSDYGLDLIERSVGFKSFLETAEKRTLEELLESRPEYFYDILPYAQTLGVSKIWDRNFEGLSRQPPDWCYGYGVEDMMYYYGIDAFSRSLSHRMSSHPSSHGSGGSDGGSSSGGGSYSSGGSSGGGGGGGGGRW
ncbi:MAG: DUF2207 domain-containing protein [Oscillospiraceae bacterium]|nr:DUF2207 domain-containing protein [Oscillospiraceae bacterium]